MTETSLRAFVWVTVEDAEGHPMPWTEVRFCCANADMAIFPNKIAVTNEEGLAVNYVERLVGASLVATRFFVDVSETRAGPIGLKGESVVVDGSPFAFHAPALERFEGSVQVLEGSVDLFIMELPAGSKVQAWSIDPRIAEPGTGTILPVVSPFATQQVLFEVLARRLGTTEFLINTLDSSVYVAEIRGDIRPRFIRGDCDGDGKVNVTDAIAALRVLFLGAPQPEVPEACNSDDLEPLNVTDVVFLLQFLFAAGEPIPPPFPEPGTDPTP